MDRATLKSMAKQQIKGNVLTFFLISLVVAIISFGLSFIPYVGSIGTYVCSCAFSLSFCIIFLNMTKGIKTSFGDMFKGFSDLWSAIKVNFLMALFIMLWSLLFYIPGIVKSYSYSMAPYILAENPGMGAREAINRSKQMMNGHKMELFVIHLSFIGWMLLSCLTCGILMIWVTPYMSATVANFYNSIKGGTSGAATVEAAGFSASDMEEIESLNNKF